MGDLATDRLREIERLKAERDDLKVLADWRSEKMAELKARAEAAEKERDFYKHDYRTEVENYDKWKARAEAAEKRLNGCRQWLRANSNAERNPDARAAFIEAHNAILAIIEDRA